MSFDANLPLSATNVAVAFAASTKVVQFRQYPKLNHKGIESSKFKTENHWKMQTSH